jgi:hypothetical protein
MYQIFLVDDWPKPNPAIGRMINASCHLDAGGISGRRYPARTRKTIGEGVASRRLSVFLGNSAGGAGMTGSSVFSAPLFNLNGARGRSKLRKLNIQCRANQPLMSCAHHVANDTPETRRPPRAALAPAETMDRRSQTLRPSRPGRAALLFAIAAIGQPGPILPSPRPRPLPCPAAWLSCVLRGAWHAPQGLGDRRDRARTRVSSHSSGCRLPAHTVSA